MIKLLIVVGAIGLHAFYGWAMLTSPGGFELRTTPTGDALDLFGSQQVCGLAFLAVAILAAVAVALDRGGPPRLGHLMLLLPQQALLMLSAAGAMSCIVAGAYADGVPRPFRFIGVDQASGIFLCVIHTVLLVSNWIVPFVRAAMNGKDKGERT